MKECNICYETKVEKILPCSHSVCIDCYDRLQGDNCPYCRQPFRESTVVTEESTDENLQRIMLYYFNNQLAISQLRMNTVQENNNRRFRRFRRFRR